MNFLSRRQENQLKNESIQLYLLFSLIFLAKLGQTGKAFYKPAILMKKVRKPRVIIIKNRYLRGAKR